MPFRICSIDPLKCWPKLISALGVVVEEISIELFKMGVDLFHERWRELIQGFLSCAGEL